MRIMLPEVIKMAVGKAVYQVLEKDGHFEIRSYEPMVLAISRETDLRG